MEWSSSKPFQSGTRMGIALALAFSMLFAATPGSFGELIGALLGGFIFWVALIEVGYWIGKRISNRLHR